MAKKDEQATAELVSPANSGVATSAVPDYLQGTKGMGNENVRQDDLAFTRLNIVQNNSPQRMKDDAQYIAGIEEGNFFDTLTKKKLDSPLIWVDVHYRKVFAVAVDRKKDAAGGILSQFDTKSEAEKFAAAHPDAAKLEVIDTPIHAGLLLTLDGTLIGPALIYMPKTKAKVSRQINGELDKLPAARLSRMWRLTTVLERNKANQPYYNFKAENIEWTPKPLFDAAKSFYDTVSKVTLVVLESDHEEAPAASSEKF